MAKLFLYACQKCPDNNYQYFNVPNVSTKIDIAAYDVYTKYWLTELVAFMFCITKKKNQNAISEPDINLLKLCLENVIHLSGTHCKKQNLLLIKHFLLQYMIYHCNKENTKIKIMKFYFTN